MAPGAVTFGLAAAVLNGWVNGVAVRGGIGAQNVGYLAAAATATATATAALIGAAPDRLGGQRGPLLLATAAYAVYGLLLMRTPLAELGGWGALLPVFVCQGVGRGNFESGYKVALAEYFPKEASSAFACVVVWSGLAMGLGAALLPYVSQRQLGAACLCSAGAALAGHLLAHRRHVRERIAHFDPSEFQRLLDSDDDDEDEAPP
jgi:MFS family permease